MNSHFLRVGINCFSSKIIAGIAGIIWKCCCYYLGTVPQSRIRITKPLSRTPSPGKSLAWVLVSSTQVMGRLHLQHPDHPRMAKFPKAPTAESYRSCHPSSSFIILHHPSSLILHCILLPLPDHQPQTCVWYHAISCDLSPAQISSPRSSGICTRTWRRKIEGSGTPMDTPKARRIMTTVMQCLFNVKPKRGQQGNPQRAVPGLLQQGIQFS